MKRTTTAISLGQRYALGWRVIGMIFSMYLALELLTRALTWLGQAIGPSSWQINSVVAVCAFVLGVLVVAPPVASLFLGLFFPLDRLMRRDE